MDQLFGSLKNLFRVDTTNIDNNVFRLHYKVTVAVLIAFSIVVTGRQYIGDPIDCISKDDIPSDVLDTFCWIHHTYSVVDAWEKKIGDEVPYPGVDKSTTNSKKIYHAYYQWVCFVLFLQALLFYTPRYFWKAMEGHRIKNLILGLNSPILPEDTKNNNRKLLVEYLACNVGNSRSYFLSLALAEIMNFVNVVGQMFLMDTFLQGEFSRYGVQVLQFTEWASELRYDPMIRVFPRLTKCIFHRFGSSGDVQRHDAMCILPINIINEKIYVFLWFWFVILAVLSALSLIYRGVTMFSVQSRYYITRSRGRLANKDYLEAIVKKFDQGDWLVIDLLCKNLDPLNFRDVVNDLARRMEGKNIDNV